MNPLDQFNLGGKTFLGVATPLFAFISGCTPSSLNPWLQTIGLILAIIVSFLSAISIITKNLK